MGGNDARQRSLIPSGSDASPRELDLAAEVDDRHRFDRQNEPNAFARKRAFAGRGQIAKAPEPTMQPVAAGRRGVPIGRLHGGADLNRPDESAVALSIRAHHLENKALAPLQKCCLLCHVGLHLNDVAAPKTRYWPTICDAVKSAASSGRRSPPPASSPPRLHGSLSRSNSMRHTHGETPHPNPLGA